MALSRSARRLARIRRLPLALLAATLITGAVQSPGVAAGPGPATEPGAGLAAAAEPERHHVTLVTGDEVQLLTWPDGRRSATLLPDEAGGGIRHNATVTETEAGLSVVPEQAQDLVDSGVLDPRLFNVTELVEQGYDDARAAYLPLIVSYGAKSRAAASAVPRGTTRTRTLDSLGAQALRAGKSTARTFWNDVVRPGGPDRRAALDGGLAHVWLDARVHVTLDRSVPQIGAPAAWQAGYDGEGVEVAVLDSGVDATHPDLKDKVVEARNFTTEGAADAVTDLNGHGTHVAGTVVGSGAASGGRYKGVAPGARLVIGKVLDKSGDGTTSAVIDAMEWAAHSGADIVSMSLGNGPGNGEDPASQAVNRLTEETGTLFVVAAGNQGPAPGTVSNPAAAASALAVAAVDGHDATASFSSRGPLADGTLKPDISAPGVDIVAARAAGTSAGTPADPYYTALSGTSMATPHVSGAAALLVQQHPDWSPRRLKDALMSTAHEAASGFDQGAGRVDVARATGQTFSATGSVSYGFFAYGDESEPVPRTVTYRNDGDTPLTLDLAVSGDDGLGGALPAGMVVPSVSDVTVPAHGSADITLTADPDAGPGGRVSGSLTATARGSAAVAHTEFGLVKEAKVAAVSVHGVNHAGEPTYRNSHASLYNLETGAIATVSFNKLGDAEFRVKPGVYSLMGFLAGFDEAGEQVVDFTLAGLPELTVGGDREVTLDGTAAKRIRVDTPSPAEHRGLLMGYERSRGSGFTLSQIAQLDQYVDTVYALPTEDVTRGTFTLFTQWVMYTPELRVGRPGAGPVVTPEYVVGSPKMDGLSLSRVASVGTATAGDIEGAPLKGRIALIRASAEVPLADQVAAVAKAGAKAAIVHATAPGRFLASAATTIPAMTLDAGPGKQLAEQAAGGRLWLTIAAEADSRVAYDLLFPWNGKVPADTTLTVDRTTTARINADYHSHTEHPQAQDLRWAFRPGAVAATTWSVPRPLPAPLHRTEWVSANGVSWRHLVYLDKEWGSHYSGPLTDYAPGDVVTESWLKQTARPVVPDTPEFLPKRGATQMSFNIVPWSDGNGAADHDGVYSSATDTLTTQLSAHGEVLVKRISGIGSFPAPYSEPTEYTLTMDSAREADYWKMSTRTHSEWRFTSARPASGTVPVPLLQLYPDLPLDLLNRAPAGRRFAFTVRTEEPGTAGPVHARTLAADVSYDDGATWTKTAVTELGDGRFRVTADHPRLARAGTGYVSLRMSAADDEGNAVEQTVVRAYRLK
ncbi:S8 family serine peptidase [Streptomyces sp. NPDC051784]|uniref:S8 family serine peptidase n=1 Tax=Streptomyces sp. NPDC051784 TaxID=3155805 RepID=UPI0034365BDF